MENDSNPRLGTVLSTVKRKPPLHEEEDESRRKGNTVLLLTGAAKVRDPMRNLWGNVDILLDTGADQSLISRELARELVCLAKRKRDSWCTRSAQQNQSILHAISPN